jgi:hypothetical protein
MPLFHLCLFPLSFFSHVKHFTAGRLVMVAHRPWTGLSVNTFTTSLDLFELFLRTHMKTVFMNHHASCNDTTPRAMVSPVNQIITIFSFLSCKIYPGSFSHLFFMFRDKSREIEMFPCKIMLLNFS